MDVRVAIGIVTKGTKVLLVQRSVKEGDLNWQFPAGKIKHMETPENAAIREVYEETGVKCIFERRLGYREHPVTGARTFYIICEYDSGQEIIKNANEIKKVRWVSLKDLGAYMPEHVYPKILWYLESRH